MKMVRKWFIYMDTTANIFNHDFLSTILAKFEIFPVGSVSRCMKYSQFVSKEVYAESLFCLKRYAFKNI